MSKSLSLLVASMLFCPVLAVAQSVADDFDFESEFNKAANEAFNLYTMFNTVDSVSSGSYNLRRSDVQDRRLDVTRLNVEHDLGNKNEEDVVPFVIATAGMLKRRNGLRLTDTQEADDFSRFESFSVGAGAGAHVKLADGLHVSPRFGVYYSRIESKYDYNSFESQLVAEPLFDEFLNFDVDTLSYQPGIELEYQMGFSCLTLTPAVRYFHMFNDSFSSSTEAIDIDSDTGVLQVGLGADAPLDLTLASYPLSLRSAAQWNNVNGEGSRSLGTNDFYDFGLALVGDLPEEAMLQEVSVGLTYIFGDHFDGWRFGVNGTF